MPEGNYRISIPHEHIAKKWKLPFVYIFSKWTDGVSTPTRKIRLDKDLEICAQFKRSLKALFKLWGKNLWDRTDSVVNRFNDFYRKYPSLFWLNRVILSFLSFLRLSFEDHSSPRETDKPDDLDSF